MLICRVSWGGLKSICASSVSLQSILLGYFILNKQETFKKKVFSSQKHILHTYKISTSRLLASRILITVAYTVRNAGGWPAKMTGVRRRVLTLCGEVAGGGPASHSRLLQFQLHVVELLLGRGANRDVNVVHAITPTPVWSCHIGWEHEHGTCR